MSHRLHTESARKQPLPAPECRHGYSRKQIEEILGSTDLLEDFDRWMTGQTMTLCTGVRWDSVTKREVPSECANNPHGPVVYPWDLEGFLSGKEPLD